MKILSIVKESYKQEITVTYINHISLIFEYTKDADWPIPSRAKKMAKKYFHIFLTL